MLNLDIPTLNLVLGVVIPLLVGVVTKLKASAGVKAVINLGLSAVAGGLAAVIEADGAVVLRTLIIGVLTTWGISLLTYYGLWKPTGVSATVQNATKNVGVGGPATLSVAGTSEFAAEDAGPAFGVLADDEDEYDAHDVDMAEHAIEPGTEALWALAPDGDEEKLRQYDLLFNGPKNA